MTNFKSIIYTVYIIIQKTGLSSNKIFLTSSLNYDFSNCSTGIILYYFGIFLIVMQTVTDFKL